MPDDCGAGVLVPGVFDQHFYQGVGVPSRIAKRSNWFAQKVFPQFLESKTSLRAAPRDNFVRKL
jgi:hypothetical protein